MKIFLLIGSLTNGGAERVTILLARHWAALGHEVALFTMHPQERDFYSLDPSVCRISVKRTGTSLIDKVISNIKGWLSLRRAIKRHQPDIMVAMMTSSVVLGIVAGTGLPVRVYGSERNYPARQKIHPVWAVLRRLVYRFADGHIAQTQKTAVWLNKVTGARNIKVIPNPVAWPIHAFDPKIDPNEVVAAERKILLAVGTKPIQKGFDLLVEAFSKLSSVYPDWDLVILGIDPDAYDTIGGGASVKKLAERLGIANRLFIPGKVGNTIDWYQRADLFVLSSRYEGIPNVLLEAMASGCPSIAFDCDTGPREIIQDGINGVLVPPENIQALSNALALLMDDEPLREKYGQNGQKVREAFSEDKIIGLWSEAIGLTSL